MAESNQTNKYAYLSRLSTKELEAILRADSESPNAVNDEAFAMAAAQKLIELMKNKTTN